MTPPSPSPPSGRSRLSLEGEIVQVRDDGRERWTKVVLTGATVLQLMPGDLDDLHLGDRVELQCSLTVEAVRVSPDRREVEAG